MKKKMHEMFDGISIAVTTFYEDNDTFFVILFVINKNERT